MRKSILFRIASPYLLLIIFVLSGLSIFLTFYSKEIYIESLTRHLEVNAKIIAEQTEPFILVENKSEQLNDIVINFSKLINQRITIISPNGVVLADSSIDASNLENHLSRAEILDAKRYGIGSDIRRSASINEELLYVAIPIFDLEKLVAYSRVSISISSINEKLRIVQIIIFGSTLLALLIATLFAFLITKRTLEPVKQLSSEINKIPFIDINHDEKENEMDEIESISHYVWRITDHLINQNEELLIERKTLNSVLDQMNDAVFIVDKEGFIQLSNPAAGRLFNFTNVNVSGKTLIEVTRNHQLFDLWKKCKNDHSQNEITFEINPQKLFVQAIAKPLDDIYPGGVLLIIQDLTRLRQLEKIRSDFVSNVSHELRTPIASIKALSDTLQEGALEDPPAARRFLSRMDVEIDNLSQMVQELLELSKIESGRVPLKKIVFSPEKLIEQAIERMQVQSERSGLLLSSEVLKDLPNIFADPDKIGQVFVNLLHNAIKFTSPGGSIKIKAWEKNGDIVFLIEDTGIGIDEISVSRIFERFYKTDPARSSGGTGLGLSITKHIIEAHGGVVWVESQPGVGSRFYFSLPKIQRGNDHS